MDATTVAIDLAKEIFEVAGANRAGRVIERKRLTRRQFERFIDSLRPGTEVVMEACGTAHYWGRRCHARDLRVRLLPVQYVRPYVRRNKTDRTDTEALLEANRCGGIQPVPVKTVEQQTLQARHRVRTQWQAARTARINVVRGLLREQGLPVPVGARTVLARVATILEDAEVALRICFDTPLRSSSTKSARSRPASPPPISSSRTWPARIRSPSVCSTSRAWACSLRRRSSAR
jgi:transposase